MRICDGIPTFDPGWTTGGLSGFDAAFAALRSGEIEPGTTVRVWCEDIGYYVEGVLEWWYGTPSMLETQEDA